MNFFCLFNCLVQEIPFSLKSNNEFENLNLNNICSNSYRFVKVVVVKTLNKLVALNVYDN